MEPVRFVFGKHGGQFRIRGEAHTFDSNCIVVTDSRACIGERGNDVRCFDFHVGDLRNLHAEVMDLLDEVPVARFWRDPVRRIKAEEDVIRVMDFLADGKPATLLRFAYVYCLGIDRQYFSALIRQSINGDQRFFEFIEENYLNQWSVTRFAEEFGIPLRKFNDLFLERYGTSAKQWLSEHRLHHARDLLLSTSMRVLDIALECGFSNHAHFTDSFRKRFCQSPTQARLKAGSPKIAGGCSSRARKFMLPDSLTAQG